MDKTFLPDRESMRTKIDFLIRTVIVATNSFHNLGLTKSEIEATVSEFATAGAAIIHKTRINGVIHLSEPSKAIETSIVKLIIAGLNEAVHTIYNANKDCPALFKISRSEMALHICVEKLTDDLMLLYTPADDSRPEAKEVANG